MATSGCLDREELAALVAGQLVGSCLERVAAHLDGCPACQAAAERLDAGLTRPGRAGPRVHWRHRPQPAVRLLALQADLIDRDHFVQACTLWATRKDQPLAALLVEQGWLSPADRADVERLLAAN